MNDNCDRYSLNGGENFGEFGNRKWQNGIRSTIGMEWVTVCRMLREMKQLGNLDFLHLH